MSPFPTSVRRNNQSIFSPTDPGSPRHVWKRDVCEPWEEGYIPIVFGLKKSSKRQVLRPNPSSRQFTSTRNYAIHMKKRLQKNLSTRGTETRAARKERTDWFKGARCRPPSNPPGITVKLPVPPTSPKLKLSAPVVPATADISNGASCQHSKIEIPDGAVVMAVRLRLGVDWALVRRIRHMTAKRVSMVKEVWWWMRLFYAAWDRTDVEFWKRKWGIKKGQQWRLYSFRTVGPQLVEPLPLFWVAKIW